MEVTISKELYNMFEVIMIIGVIGLTVLLGSIFKAIFQVTQDIENYEMYKGGDIIGIGDNTDTINSDTTTSMTGKKNRTNK